jgi:hypothetical protein
MSIGEVVGLTLTVAVFGAAAGAAVAAAIIAWSRRGTSRRMRYDDAFAQWLAAWMNLSRTSVSLVAAFRALAAEGHDSEYFSLRQDEAQRARAAWCDAMRELDRAEAGLVARSASPIRADLARFVRVSPAALRAAINGDQQDVDALVKQLGRTTTRVAEFVEATAIGEHSVRPPMNEFLTRAGSRVQAIVRSWSERI